MSFELVYTSAQRGLKPNSSGFCTVAATGGISRLASMKLEGLSAYEFHFNLSDANANLNPANFAHTVVKVGGKRQSVLSRIGFAGPDYSGRANKIAHHFLLGDQERLGAGPGEMLLQLASGKFCKQWQGQPSNLQPCSLAESLNNTQPSGPAGHWQSVAGDAGWAGMLAKAFKEGGRVPAYVIYAPGTDVLKLFAESLAVLPPQQRWEVNFATYYTSMPAGCYYNWRGILAGSRAAQEIAKFPNATVIDLTKPLGQAPDNEYTNAARSGQALAAAAGISAGLQNIDLDEADDLDDIYKLAQEDEPSMPTKRRRKVAAPIDMLAAGAAQTNAMPPTHSNKGLKITIAVLSLLVAALLITTVLTLSFFKDKPTPATTGRSGELAKNTGGPPTSAPKPTSGSPPATQQATSHATSQEDTERLGELAHWRNPIAAALDSDDIDKADGLFANLDNKAPDWVHRHQKIVSLKKRLTQARQDRKDKFIRCMKNVSIAGVAKPDKKSLEEAKKLGMADDEKSQVEKWGEIIKNMEQLENNYATVVKASSKRGADAVKADIKKCLTLANEIKESPLLNDKDKERLASIRKDLDERAKPEPKYDSLKYVSTGLGGKLSFLGDQMGAIFGDVSSGSKEFKFKKSGSIRQIRFFKRLAETDRGRKLHLRQAGKFVQLIIRVRGPVAGQEDEIAIAEYRVSQTPPELRIQLLGATSEHKDLVSFAQAVVVDVSGPEKNADIYQCRIRQDKDVTLRLGFEADGKICIPKCYIKYPWPNLLKLKLSKKHEAFLLNKDGARNLPAMPIGVPPTLSWTLNREEGKLTFSIKTGALENWRKSSDDAWKQVKPLYDKWQAHEKDKGKVKKEQGKNWDEKKWKKNLDNKWNDFDREAKQTLDPIFENIKKFAVACNSLDEIVIRDPWGVTLETFKVKFPMPPNEVDREFVMLLGKQKK